jgi:hypothetical protein
LQSWAHKKAALACIDGLADLTVRSSARAILPVREKSLNHSSNQRFVVRHCTRREPAVSSIVAANSTASSAVALLLSSAPSSSSDPVTQNAAQAARPSVSSGGPEDRIQVSDRAKALLARAKMEQAAADKLSALLDRLIDPTTEDASPASSLTVSVSESSAASQAEIFAPKVSFASRLSIGGFSISATGNADTWSSDIRIEGPNGLTITDTVFGGGKGAPTAESGGVSGLPPGTTYASQKIGNKQYFTISSTSAAAATVVGGGAVGSAIAAEATSTTIVIDFDTGGISLTQSELSTVATVGAVTTGAGPSIGLTPSVDNANAAVSAYTSERVQRITERANAERSVVDQLAAQVNAHRGRHGIGHRFSGGPDMFDVMVSAGSGAVVTTGSGNDAIRTYGNAIVDAGGGNDRVSTYGNSIVQGGAGSDRISTYGNSIVLGGEGSDRISTYGNSIVLGGEGNDRISTYSNSIVLGGAGSDRIEGYGNVVLDGGAGDDKLSAYDHANLTGGVGNDTIDAYRHAVVDAGSGDDTVSTYGFAVISAGSGNDRVTTGDTSNVDGGAGDDVLRVGGGSIVSGGTGDDSIQITGGNTTVNFGKGDGHDVVKAYEDVTVAISGYSRDDVIVTRGHGSTMVTFKDSDDSLLIDASNWTGATLTFADGGSLHVDA